MHTQDDCDETCHGCVKCYVATGDTVCDKTCPHAKETEEMEMVVETWSDLPESVRLALFKAQDWAREKRSKSMSANAAFVYIMALNDSIMAYGTHGAKTQLLYIIGNLGAWTGDDARAAKKVLKSFVETI
jgi:hypothetical protein